MATLQDIIQRAEALREETALNSISPDRAGGIMYDTLLYINQMQLQESNPLLISKIYASVAAMEADSAPVSDLTGKPLVAGQVVCIATGDPDDPDEGVIYRYDGTTEGTSSWTAVGRFGSDPYLEGYLYAGIATPSADPGFPTQKVFYIAATPGTYEHFDNLVVSDGEVAILKYDSAWSKEVTGAATASQVNELSDLANKPLWEQGSINENGIETSSSERIRSSFIVRPFSIILNSGYSVFRILRYNNDLTFSDVLYYGGNSGSTSYDVTDENYKYRVVVCKTGGGGMTPTDNFLSSISGNFTSDIENLDSRVDVLETFKDDGANKRFSIASSQVFTESHYLKRSNGAYTETSQEDYRATSEYTIVLGCARIIACIPNMVASATTTAMVCFYDIDKNFISSYVSENEREITLPNYIDVPPGAYYARFAGYSRSADEWSKVFIGFIASPISGFLDQTDLSDTINYSSGILNHHLEITANDNIDHSQILEAKAGDLLIYSAGKSIGSNENLLMINEDESAAITLVRAQTAINWVWVFNRNTKFSINVRKENFDFHWYRSRNLSRILQMQQELCTVFDSRKYIPLLANAKMPSMRADVAYEDILSLLHFSDVHATVDNLQRALDFKSKFNEYIDDIIHTGDICSSKFGIWNPDLEDLPGYNKMLQVIGNHDVYDAHNQLTNPYDDPAYWATPAEKYARYMKYVGDWGVIQPENASANGYCYYYKDYASAKIRLIVLDAMAFDATQLSWFESVLASSITAGYAVVVADHFKPTTGPTDVTPFDTPFCALNDLMSPDTATQNLNGAPAAIDTFINNGGEFVCWLCGHTHYDQVAKVVSHPNQMFICVGKASYIAGWQDSARIINQDSEDLFNIVAFDYHQKIIKVFRVGGEVDQYMRHRGGFCLNWQTKTLLNTW